ncbi:hypothetical protein, partial [Kocuria salsicia]|uniref:hypothetical protein n=1 Tax=Kocuria salsicia TaxID=664639 RepID=UPI00164396A7
MLGEQGVEVRGWVGEGRGLGRTGWKRWGGRGKEVVGRGVEVEEVEVVGEVVVIVVEVVVEGEFGVVLTVG